MNSSIALAGREWNGTLIHQRITDGYVNATAMCQANNARLNNYLRNARTCAYINALAAETGILATCLVQLTRGGRPDLQGTWVHPRLSVDLARWISPAFAVFMDGWFLDWIQGGRQEQPAPAPAPVQLPAAQRDSYYFRRHWERFSHSPEQRWSQTTDIGRLAMALACLVEDEQAGGARFGHPTSGHDHRTVIADAAGEIARHYCGAIFGTTMLNRPASPGATRDHLLSNTRSITAMVRGDHQQRRASAVCMN